MNLEDWGLIGLFVSTFLAATVVPFSSDAIYIGVLAAGFNPVAVLVVGTLGNWLGGVTTYFIGRVARWEWIERLFKVKRETLDRQKALIDRWGVWIALISWVPFIGDVIVIALGFYKTPAVPTLLLLLIGKLLRFIVWTLFFI